MLASRCIREISNPGEKNLRLCQEKPQSPGKKPESGYIRRSGNQWYPAGQFFHSASIAIVLSDYPIEISL